MPVNLIISMNIFLLARDLNLLKNKLLLNYIICVLNFNSVPLNGFSAPSSSWTHLYVATSFGAIFKLNILLLLLLSTRNEIFKTFSMKSEKEL